MSNSYFISNWTGRGRQLGVPTANNLAGWFNPSIPMCGPEYNAEKVAVLMDVPEKLAQALEDGLQPIGMDCIKQNAQVVFHFFENTCVEHVLSLQMQNRLVRRLTQRDPSATDSTERSLVPEGRLARSSLIGRDICGELARPVPDGSDSDSGGNAQPAKTTEDAAEASKAQSGEGKKKKKKKKEYSGLQLLMIAVQDKTYLYLTVHVFSIVDPFFRDLLRNKEKDYKADKDNLLSNSARNRMPWSAYKELILARLQEGGG